MTGADLKAALLSGCPVMCDGIQYLRVCEIVYRCPENKVVVSAGLLDRNGKCIVYARPEKVSFANEI